jgi:uncharacterized protein (TIGR00288 family)
MNSRNPKHAPPRSPVAPIHRGPQAMASASSPGFGGHLQHAPNAALLIDFDNVTMGIQTNLGTELRNLLSSDIIKGKVAVQRAYADWRRYPQYIVPLAESSIDMIMAPAYGSSKKNATDIRLAVDAMELVFTRSEIGTYILLSGDSDFASLVTKLKEYGKYVIGVGIRESSSDLLVMNCDEYYSYNALAGLVRTADEEHVKWDPWQLVTEALQRMKRNGDTMRADRLKQVMQDIDPSFDEKNLGMPKFSRFCQEAAHRGLIRLVKGDNGQFEVDLPEKGAAPEAAAPTTAIADRPRGDRPEREEGGRRRGGRGRDRRPREGRTPAAAATEGSAPETAAAPADAAPAATSARLTGERLSRDEAYDLLGRALTALGATTDAPVMASVLRKRAHEMLGRDSESLSERNFDRILQDAHDRDVIDLRKRGNDYEVAPASAADPITTQLAAAEAPAPSQAARSAAGAASIRRGMGLRRTGPRGRVVSDELPPELMSIGVVEEPAAPAAPREEEEAAPAAKAAARKTRGRKTAARKSAAGKTKAADSTKGGDEEGAKPKAKRPRAKKTPASAAKS